MYAPRVIDENLYYIGVNDRHKQLFEQMIPLPYGVSYNSYLIVDEKVVLIDCVEECYIEQFLAQIEAVVQSREIDYLIVNHMEPDHSSSIKAIRRAYPNIQIIGNAKTIGMIDGFYGIKEGMKEVVDGDQLNIGSRTLNFYLTPMVHWPEVMMTYDSTNQILFSADAFGTFGTLDGAVLDKDLNMDRFIPEMYRYYANIVGKYGSPVQKALGKLAALPTRMICSTHGPVWTKYIGKVIDIYNRMSRYEGEKGVVVVYGSMYGHTEQMAEVVAQGVASRGVPVTIYDVSKTHVSFILSDIFKYQGLIVGSPTYCNELFPEIKSLLDKIETRGIKQRTFGCFGTFTWAGAAIKGLHGFAARMKWEVKYDVEMKMAISEGKYKELFNLGANIAQSINQSYN